MLKRTVVLSCVTALATLSLACAPAGMPVNLADLARLDIQGAKSLVLAGHGTNQYRVANGGPQGTTLYKLTASEQLEPVSAYGIRGDALGSGAAGIKTLLPINRNFVFVGSDWGGHLIRLSDGKAVRVSDPSYSGQPGSRSAQVDGQGNLFVLSQYTLYKVQIPSPDKPDQVTKTALTHEAVEEANRFIVDRSGLVVAETRLKSNRPEGTTRLFKPSGGVAPFPAYSLHNAWVGTNGKLYTGLEMLSLGADGQAILTPVTEAAPDPDNLLAMPYMSSFHHHGQLDDRDVFGNAQMYTPPGESAPKASLHFIKDLEHRVVHLKTLSSIDSLAAARQTVYAIGNHGGSETRLVSYNASTGTERILFDDSNYLLLKVMVGLDETVSLSALRLSDNTYVLGRLNSDGQLSVINSELPPVQQILTLE